MKKIPLTLSSLFLTLASQLSPAASLIDVYNDALQNDQTFKQAEATLLDNQEVLPQARSLLLPQIIATGQATGNEVHTATSTPNFPSQNQTTNPFLYNYGLTLTQPLFNAGALYGYGSAKASVAQAIATYSYASQDLIVRTASAYFAILQAQETLEYSSAQTAALDSQLQVSKQRYQVGLDPITALYQAQAAYHAAVSTELASRNALFDTNENLRVITNKNYPDLDRLDNKFGTVAPEPNDIDLWTQAGIEKNLQLKAARFGVLAAQDLIKTQQGNRLPTINLVAGYNSNETQFPQLGTTTTNVANTVSVGLQGQFNAYTGGAASSAVRKAKADYLLANASSEQSYRSVIASTRKSFRSVLIGISEIEADRDAITSGLAALKSAEAGYKAGTQIFTTVLQQQQALYQAQTTYATDSFNYLLTTLQLKEAVGTLSKEDLMAINQWLSSDRKATVSVADKARVTK